MGRLTRLTIAFLLCLIPAAFIPGGASAQSMCHGRSACHVGHWVAAGHDAAGLVLRLAKVETTLPEDGERPERCSRGAEEYWLRRGNQPARLIGDVCMDSQHSEGITVVIGNNRLTTSFSDNNGCCYGFDETVYQLAPLRILRATNCSGSRINDAADNVHERWVQTRLDRLSLQGESLSNVGPIAVGLPRDVEDGCSRRGATRRWLPILQLSPSTLAIAAGDSLGSCATVMGSGQGGYRLSGPQTAFEVRMLAPSVRSLIIQVVDRDADISAGPTSPSALNTRSHLEVWVSDQSRYNMTTADETHLSGLRIDAATGRVEQISGPAFRPRVSHWQVRRPDGALASLVRLDFPPPADRNAINLSPALTVLYRHFDGRVQTASVASSLFTEPRLSSLGETLDISSFGHCRVRDHVLEAIRPGYLDVPFQAQLGGLAQ